MPAYKDSKTGTWFVKFYCKDWTGENKQIKKRGFATFGRENFIEVCPPLIITKEELEEYLPILDEVLTMADEKFCD